MVIAFLPRSKRVLISWLQSPSAVILGPKKIKSDTVSTVSKITKSRPYSIKVTKSGEINAYKLHFNIQHTINETDIIQKISESEHVTNVSWVTL